MTTRHTTLRRLAISMVPVLFVAGLAGSCVPHPTESDPLAQYYKQDLAFGSCAEFATTALEDLVFDAVEEAECAYLQVPVDYEDPRGETAQVAVTRLAADGNPIGSLVVNPGGPGGSGLLQGVVADANLAGTPITENFDIIGMDPRGVGASTPSADCVSDESADQGGNLFPQAALQGSWSAEQTQELVERCAEASGGENFLANVGTRDAARDLDVLREVLGDEKLSYLGQSYGTRLGAVYAEMFPENVRALVLDGAADPTLGTVERRITQYTGFQAAFDSMATDCSKEEDCILGTDPDQAVEKFQSITRPLIDEPITTAAGRTVDYNVAVGAVTAGLYNSEQWPDVLAGIEELAAGRADTLLAISDEFGMRDENGVWGNYLEANFAVNCMDEERRTPEQEEEFRAEVRGVAPFMDPGDGVAGARDGCEAWPADPDLGFPYAEHPEGLPETLTISVTGDPASPYEGGLSLSEQLDGAHLTVEGKQHTIAMSGANDCVNEAVADYLVDLEVPEEDARCIA